MKYYSVLFFVFVFILSSCKKNTVSVETEKNIPEWSSFSIVQVDYDSLQIVSQNQIKIDDNYVEKIVFSVNNGDSFSEIESVEPTYIAEDDYYYLNYSFSKKVESDIVDFNFKVDYYLKDQSVISIDSSTSMLKYPYSNSMVFLTTEDLSVGYPFRFQDIDLDDNFLFFHPTGPDGIYKYGFDNAETNELLSYGGGDFIAQDSGYIFYEIGGNEFYRYNIKEDTTDLVVSPGNIINGLECYQGSLFVVTENSGNYTIAEYDYSGNLLSTVPYFADIYLIYR